MDRHLNVHFTKGKKMTIKKLFPTYVFEWDFLGEDSNELMTPEYFRLLREEMDAMRRRDPVGRSVSNAYTGWQSNDRVDDNPIFQKCIRQIKKKVREEIAPTLGMKNTTVNFHNAWANINDNMAWNKPHLHNGCMYSGAFYIQGDGDEGHFVAVDTDYKFVGNVPRSQTAVRESYSVAPKTGFLIMFPSGLMHMVEPNPTQKDRYSISFNLDFDGDRNEENHNYSLSYKIKDEHGNLAINE